MPVFLCLIINIPLRAFLSGTDGVNRWQSLWWMVVQSPTHALGSSFTRTHHQNIYQFLLNNILYFMVSLAPHSLPSNNVTIWTHLPSTSTVCVLFLSHLTRNLFVLHPTEPVAVVRLKERLTIDSTFLIIYIINIVIET